MQAKACEDELDFLQMLRLIDDADDASDVFVAKFHGFVSQSVSSGRPGQSRRDTGVGHALMAVTPDPDVGLFAVRDHALKRTQA